MSNALLPTLLGAVVAPTVLGAGLVRASGLSPRDGWRQFAAWAWFAGQFATAWLLAAWLWLRPPWPGFVVPLVAALAGGAAWWFAAQRSRAHAPPAAARRTDRWLAAATIVALALVAERASWTSLHAIVGNDEANIWAAKAKCLFADGGFARWAAAGYAQHLDYPLWNPLQQALAFASSDRVLLWENRLPLQVGSLACVLLASAAFERAGRALGIALLLALATSRFLFYAGSVYADVLVAFALLATVHALDAFVATGERRWWRLACLGLAGLLASKNEGAMLACALLGALAVARIVHRAPLLPRPGRDAVWLALPAATLLAGQWFNHAHGLANDLTETTADGRGLLARIGFWLPERLATVAAHFGDLSIDGGATRWLLVAMAAAVVLAGRTAWRAPHLWPWLTAACAVGGYLLVFVGTPIDPGGTDGPARGLAWHLATAADRTLLHLLPLAAFAIAVLAAARRGAAPPPPPPPPPADALTAR